jgi:2-polyprenyl-3-methyl-5-hydroxy-6-metoxy-1,4-benzoquinol methylase
MRSDPITEFAPAPQEDRTGECGNKSPRSGNVLSWEETLSRPPQHSLYKSMVAELAEYLSEQPDTVAASCEAGRVSVAEEWKARQLGKESPPSDVVAFYRTTTSYLFDLTTFNSEYPHTATLESLVEISRKRGLRKVLDFGSGIGSVGLFFALNGMEVTLADVSEPLMEYAAWRFKARGLKLRLINLNREELPKDTFDVVTAFDVLEHLPRPADTLRTLATAMKSGGVIALNVEEAEANFPQHIATYEEVFSTVAAAGFHRLQFLGKTEVFKRVERGPISTAWHSFWGKVWYRFLYRKVISVLDALEIKMTVRKWIKGPKG